jgi:hypothetical protein
MVRAWQKWNGMNEELLTWPSRAGAFGSSEYFELEFCGEKVFSGLCLER